MNDEVCLLINVEEVMNHETCVEESAVCCKGTTETRLHVFTEYLTLCQSSAVRTAVITSLCRQLSIIIIISAQSDKLTFTVSAVPTPQ